MNTHKNAPLTPKGREAMVRSVVEGGLNKADDGLPDGAKVMFDIVPNRGKESAENLRMQ